MENTNVIFVVGAARSGTTMTRTILSYHHTLFILPYEINYLWRYGNDLCNHDFLTQNMLSPRISKYIQKSFAKALKKSGKERLVDKTVANICRLEYLKAVFPQAQFIHIIRSPLDAIHSTYLRWQRPIKSTYALKKGITIPWRSLPYYGLRFIFSKLIVFFTRQQKISSWGPRFPEIDKYIKEKALIETCAKQWCETIKAGIVAGRKFNSQQYLEIRYENAVQNPRKVFKSVFDFLSLTFPVELESHIDSYIDPHRIGKGTKSFSKEEMQLIQPHLSEATDLI